jgi:allophanate hydrolase subunit 2
VLGSRSTDTLSGLGPAPIRTGDRLALGHLKRAFAPVDVAPVTPPSAGDTGLRVLPGPRADWFAGDSLHVLCSAPFVVGADSDRVGMRLDGPVLRWARTAELPSEGVVAGALQVPPSGRAVLLLADHPVTGGYPVLATVLEEDVDRAAQARPGQRLTFRRVRAVAL